MDAQQFKLGLRFVGGMPTIVVRDHTPAGFEPGRIALYRGGEHIGTVVPGHMLGHDGYDAILLDVNAYESADYEMRGSWAAAQAAVSILQQSGSWTFASEAHECYCLFERQFDL